MSSLLKQGFSCSRCGQHIEVTKQGPVKCSCGADLVIVKTGGKYLMCDVVPPKKEDAN